MYNELYILLMHTRRSYPSRTEPSQRPYRLGTGRLVLSVHGQPGHLTVHAADQRGGLASIPDAPPYYGMQKSIQLPR